MTMKKLNILFIAFGMLALLSSCDDYLDKLPDDRASLDTEEKITQFLISCYGTRNNAYVQEYSSDNVGFNGSQYQVQPNQDKLYHFEDVETENNDDPRSLWNNYYAAVASANIALDAIDQMGNPASLKGQRAEALLCRAWGMFRLATLFCMAYDPTKEYLGLPYPKVAGVSVNERGTLTELYDNINADIEEALPNVSDLHLSNPKFHFNRKAAYAFAARFNLYYLKWEKAVQYANEVLGTGDPTAMLRDWSEYVPYGNAEIGTSYINSGLNCNLMIHNAYSIAGRCWYYSTYRRYGYSPSMRGYELYSPACIWGRGTSITGNSPTQSLVQAAKNYGSSPNFRFPRITETFEYTDKTGNSGYAHIVDVPFTTDETLLVRAEANTMLKKYEDAVRDINYWLTTHCVHNAVFKLTSVAEIDKFMSGLSVAPAVPASDKERSIRKALHPQGFSIEEGTSQEYILQLLLHMRRLETQEMGLRFNDIKRYGITYSHIVPEQDDPLVFEVGDPRGAIQIPNDVINAGITPNPRGTAAKTEQ